MADKIQLYVNDSLVFNQAASGPGPTPTGPTAPTGPTPTGPTTPPPGSPAEVTLKARSRVSQNCAWGGLLTPDEHNWAMSVYGTQAVAVRVNYFATANVQEYYDSVASPSGYMYQTIVDGIGLTSLPDVNQAADVRCTVVMNGVAPPPPLF